MHSAAPFPLPRLKAVTRPVAIALFLLFPFAAVADRPRIRPHHKVPAKAKRIIAARVAAARTATATGSTTVNQLTGGSGMYLGGTTTTLAAMSLRSTVAQMEAAITAVGSIGTLALSNHDLTTGLVKSGSGTLTLGSSVVFTGNTTVNSGMLSLSSSLFPDAGGVSLVTGGTLSLNFNGSDTINQLRIDGVIQSPGTWGGIDSSATFRTALITGTGILNVTGNGGTLVVNPPVLETGGATLTLAGGSHIATAGVLTLNGANVVNPASGTLSLNGAGVTVATSGANATLANGTLITNPTSAVSAGSNLVINSGSLSTATLSISGESPGTSAAAGAGGVAPIPEPSAALLAALGMGILSLRRRRG